MKNIESEYYHSNNNNNNNNSNNYNSNNQGQRRKFHLTTDKVDEKYWNNMDNKEYLERKHQHLFDQNSTMGSGVIKNHCGSNPNEYYIDYNGKNRSFDQIVRNTKSWSVK